MNQDEQIETHGLAISPPVPAPSQIKLAAIDYAKAVHLQPLSPERLAYLKSIGRQD
jgi:hypothetical protein